MFQGLRILWLLAAILAATLLKSSPVHAAPAAELVIGPRSRISIVLPRNATLSEKTASQELSSYLARVTGSRFTVQRENERVQSPAIFVGNTEFAKRAGVNTGALASEEWQIRTRNGSLILTGGGTRGTLYATYHFLEDVVGVRWWTPWEEHIPARQQLTVPPLDVRGKPAFSYRDIYLLYANDHGRFATRRRVNHVNDEDDTPIAAKYGGGRGYGPPSHVHTFYLILDPKKYYKDHPDWFLIEGGGELTRHNSQLHLSNPEMRAEFLKLLKELIRQSQREARAQGLPAPDVFSVSQEDNPVKFTGPNDAQFVAENGGAESAILLDFINYLADGIKDEFPDVYIDTLGYFSLEKAPTKIRPRENVIIRLTDTTSNLILPITHERNIEFRRNIESWGKLTRNLRVWDYAITFNYIGLPMPTESTYPVDLRFWKANNVDGIFVEHEYPILADRRDFKVWLQCKLYENPDADYDSLVREFTDGYYGAAGRDVRDYFLALDAEAQKVGAQQGFEDVHWFAEAWPYNYMTLDFLLRAHAMMDSAESKAGKSGALQRRVRHARMSLDRFTLLFFRKFRRQWERERGAAQAFPLDHKKIAARISRSWNEQIDMRLPRDKRAAERRKAAAEVNGLATSLALKVPDRFKGRNAEVYGPGNMRRFNNQAKVVRDADAEMKWATRLLMSDVPAEQRATYKLPMEWGIYDTLGKTKIFSNTIPAESVPGPGYHWYKLGQTAIASRAYAFFTWSWLAQIDLADMYEEARSGQKFEVWAEMKFDGPSFPHGRTDSPDSISVSRVVIFPH